MEDDDEEVGIPEWVVTFGDMMSLLLTFFIMLVSMSEIKEEEKFQAMVESMRRKFGHALTMETVAPGDFQPRRTEYKTLSTEGRAKKLDTHKGGAPTDAPVGDHQRVRIIRPGTNTGVGTIVFFEDGAIELNADAKQALDKEAEQLKGKPQKIEVRGHTSQHLAALGHAPLKSMDLAYRRCRSVMDYLVEQHEIPPERIRMSSAGAFEPMYQSTDQSKLRMNPRVEVFLVEETVDELVGTKQQRQRKVADSLSEE